MVSEGSGTFRHMADHVARKIVAKHDQIMSRLPRPFGEDVHPCNVLDVMLVDMLDSGDEDWGQVQETKQLVRVFELYGIV